MRRGRTIARHFLLSATLSVAALGQAQSHPSTSDSIPGNPALGKQIFDGPGKCLSCHRAGASGSVLGPNLSNIGAQLPPDRMRQWLLDPPQKAESENLLYEIVTRDGKIIRGKLLNQDPFSLQILDSRGELLALPRSQVQKAHVVDPPPMPSYQGKLPSTGIDDLVAYLASLRVPEDQ